ncbi:MAG: thioredoxin-dependent thiol peroxidase [Blastochloris viridis]|uniref:thioredoxin-dependent peroxiredoxin n=1 Tax=Blastochloris viridis TaxID=1079 RepID=A0A6N4R0K9_BLAVI|nr:MAG: thioredoxin-dependent thiol peroxidase [Blastochloris viridis]
MQQAPRTIPHLELLNQDGTPVQIAETLGKFVVIYFYPKAMTSGCTEQACAIRDNKDVLSKLNAITYGISPDAPATLVKFKQKEGLNFDLLSDNAQILANQFHSWVQKSMYGRTYMGLSRDIFIYSPQGDLVAAKRKISPKDHINFVVESISHYQS